MDTTLYVALSHQTAMRRHMDVLANNIANMSTTGFRRERVIFQEYLTEMRGTENPAAEDVAFVLDHGVRRDFQQGSLVPTGNPLDVAISGRGFFTVEDAETGDIHYTRNGHFRMSEDGFLALDGGFRLLGADGAPVAVSGEDDNLTISADGTIASSQGVVGRIEVVNFEDEHLLERVGENMFTTEQAPLPAENARLEAGMVEAANVNPIEEMTNMINVMRSYQSVARMIDKYQDLRSRGIERLGRVQ